MLDGYVVVGFPFVEAWGSRYYVVERRNFDMQELVVALMLGLVAYSLDAYSGCLAACCYGLEVGGVAEQNLQVSRQRQNHQHHYRCCRQVREHSDTPSTVSTCFKSNTNISIPE
jgi:hypothetical protein